MSTIYSDDCFLRLLEEQIRHSLSEIVFKAGEEREKERASYEEKRTQEKLLYQKLCWGNFGQL